MALAPLRFPIQPPGLQTRPDLPALTRAPPLRPVAVPDPVPASTPSADALAEDIDAAREGSLEYRLITALLLRDADRDALRQTLNAGDSLRSQGEVASSASATARTGSASTTATATTTTATVGNSTASVTVLSAELTRVDVSLELLPEGMQLQISASRLQVVAVNVSASANAGNGSQRKDPLLLDLDGDGAETSGLGAGTVFDIDGDGQLEQVSFASGGDAFLALDRNGNGHIDDGRELFGDQHGATHGFAELARFDGNGDQRIDAGDAVYQQLRLISWQDGVLHSRSLADAGISAINLDWRDELQELANGDAIAQSGSYTRNDGSSGAAHDVLISVDARV